MHPILAELLARPGPVVMDGAMGTQLIAAGLPAGTATASWNLTHPGVVRRVHQEYRAAGAEVLLTNTFSAHPERVGDRLAEVVAAAVRLVREAAAGAPVLGDVGPRLPAGDYRPVIRCLVDAGVDGIFLETAFCEHDLIRALEAAKDEAPDLPLFACATFLAPQAPDPLPARRLAEIASSFGCSGTGANCTLLPDPMGPAVMALAGASLRIVARASDGVPEVVPPHGPADWARLAAGLTQLGARWVGGCCGTTPAHIAALARSLHHSTA